MINAPEQVLSVRMLRSGALNFVAFGSIFLLIRFWLAGQAEAGAEANMVLMFANMLPVAMLMALVLLVVGTVLRLRGR